MPAMLASQRPQESRSPARSGSVVEVAAARLARRHGLAGLRIELDPHEAALARLGLGRLVKQQDQRLAVRRRRDEPALGVDRVLAEIALGRGHGLLRGRGPDLDLGLHPARDLRPEECQRAGQEHREQRPAEDQPRPGVQPGHGLAQALLALLLVVRRLHAGTRRGPPDTAGSARPWGSGCRPRRARRCGSRRPRSRRRRRTRRTASAPSPRRRPAPAAARRPGRRRRQKPGRSSPGWRRWRARPRPVDRAAWLRRRRSFTGIAEMSG